MQNRKEEENKVSIKVANLAPKKLKRKNDQNLRMQWHMLQQRRVRLPGPYAGSGRRGDVRLPGTFAEAASAVDIDLDTKSTLVGKSVSISEINDIEENSSRQWPQSRAAFGRR